MNKKKISEILKNSKNNGEKDAGFYEGITYKKMEVDDYKEIFQRNSKPRHTGLLKIGKVAAIVAGFFLISGAMMLALNNDSVVSGVKGKIGQIITKDETGTLSVKDEGIGSKDDNVVKEVKIEEWDKVQKARNFLPELYIPNYIPNRYQFIDLRIKNNAKGFYYVEYSFDSSDGKELFIRQCKKPEEDEENLIVFNYDTKTLSDGKTIYTAKGDFEDSIIATFIIGNDKFDISGAISQIELEKIVINLEK